MVYKVLIFLSILSVIIGIYLFIGLQYPRKWKRIERGLTSAQIKSICPGLQQDLHDIKGDFCSAGIPLIRWSLQVIYGPDNSVANAHLVLFLGTERFFKRIYVRELAA
jgi:hypothetical protein